MKKKLVATLVAGVVLSTGIIGLTACGNSVYMPKGEEIADATAWAKAFVDTMDLTNYTYESSSSVDVKIEGTVNKNYDPWDGLLNTNKEVKNVNLKYTGKSSEYNLALIDSENDKIYAEMITSEDTKDTTDGKEHKEKSSSTEKYYYELKEKNDLDKTYWNASYSKEEKNGTDGKSSSESYWTANEDSYSPFTYSPLSIFAYFSFYEKDEEGTLPQSITALYDAFTYSGGVYSATLYQNTKIGDTSAYDLVKVEVKVSFSDGHVIGLSYKANKVSDTITKENAYDIKYTYSTEAVYAIKDVKKTDVSKKANKDIKNAIQEAKDEAEDN